MEELKKTVCAVIDEHREAIIGLGEKIWARPESGFKEHETARLVAGFFRDIGLPCREGLAVTGVRAELKGARPGPGMALLGEMDGIILPGHPAADPVTGAVHACGHHAQIAGLLGATLALNRQGVTDRLSGRIILMAVPAEEFLELDFRRKLALDDKIRYLGGKQELIRLGHFDDVDLAMMIHTGNGRKASVRRTMNGFTSHYARFIGRAAHAGADPHLGVNALNAANLALQAIHSQRETFPEGQYVRVHSIIRKGGESVSTVPDDVQVETMVRAKTVEAVMDASRKARRCYRAGAMAAGGKVAIEAIPGYLPLNDCTSMADVFRRNAGQFVGAENVDELGHMASSTDMGDVTQIMPATHPSIGGAVGNAHSAEFRITDPELAYVVPAKVMAMCAIDLLCNDAALARDIIKRNPPLLSRAAYKQALEAQSAREIHDYME